MSAKKSMTHRNLSWHTFAMLFLISLTQNAFAGKFANQFTEFELPAGWTCGLEKVTWVCQHMEDKKKREALIVLGAKIRGPQDSMEQYQNRLSAAKNYTTADGKSVTSEAKFIKSVQINGHPWIDALHSQSEVPGFMTRYFATIEQNIGVLVTFSVENDKYSQYVTDLTKAMNSLKVFKKSAGPAAAVAFQNTQIPTKVESDTVFGTPQALPKDEEKTPTLPPADNPLLPLMVLFGVVAAFLLWKRRG